MKRLMSLLVGMLIGLASFAQTLTLTNPAGLTEPYEVQPGTVITVQWDYYNTEPTVILTYDQDPGNLDSYQYSLNSEWTQHSSGWTDNGDGTYNFTYTVNEPVWIWGAYYTSSMGYAYSNVNVIEIASLAEASFTDGLICPTGGDNETLSITDTFTTYQWYQDGAIISSATNASYNATQAGTYYVIVDDNGTTYQSNQLLIQEITLSYNGSLDQANDQLTLTSNETMDSYQWYSGPDMSNLSPISGATSQSYVADITSTLTYYMLEGSLGSCVIQTEGRPVEQAIFEPVVITASADTNSYGNVCEGTVITLSIDIDNTVFSDYDWYKNGYHAYGTDHVTINSAYKTGDYYVISVPVDWPETQVQSATVNADYFEVIEPNLTGVANNAYYCAGEDISITLTDEGYNYTWYQHTASSYNDTDEITVPSGTYEFTFENDVYISVLAEYQACEASKKVHLKDYSDVTISLGIDNSDQRYLCTDSLANLKVSYNESNYENFQWQKLVGSVWQDISGATASTYSAPDSGFYKLTATHASCPNANVESSSYQVYDYTERSIYEYIYPYSGEICIGDSAKLKISGSSWTNIQWLEGDIQMTASDGYQKMYVGIPNSDSTIIYVDHFNTYIVKVKHESCPNGLKLTSDTLELRPKVNPDITMISQTDFFGMKPTLLDSAKQYLTCDSATVEFEVDGEYNTYQWYRKPYGYQNEDYSFGDQMLGETSDTISTPAGLYWFRAMVTDADACVGISEPILIDVLAIQSPDVESHYNGELCVGDTTYVNLGFPGDWTSYVWYNNGILMPGENNDTLWVTEPGSYIIGAYHAACPNEIHTSGVGAPVHYLEGSIQEDVDNDGNEIFYAWPWQGDYTFQWYLDGQPIQSSSINPAVIYKDSLPAGILTVEITNLGLDCSDMSEEVVWEPTGINEAEIFGELSIYPNPSDGIINITGINTEYVETISVYNVTGEKIASQSVNSNFISFTLTDLPSGIYIVKIESKNGEVSTHKIVKR